MTRIDPRPVPAPPAPSAPAVESTSDDAEAWHALASLAACHDLALQVSNLATFELDDRRAAVRWSDNAGAVLGCDDDAVQRRLADLLRPLATVAAPPDADFELEQRITTDTGEERWVLVSARSWRGRHLDAGELDLGAPAAGAEGLYGTILDVTERRSAERELVDLIDRYRLLVELSPDGLAVHEGGIVRYCNPACGRLRGASPSTVVGQHIATFVHPDELGGMVERIAGLAEPGMVSAPTDTRIMRADGGEVLCEVVSVRTTWEGRPAFQVILRDLTDRERADAALRTQAELVEAVSDAIISMDDDERITTWNRAAERIFGWSADEVVGHAVHEFEGLCAAFGDQPVFEALGALDHWAGELLVTRQDGSPVPVHASVAKLGDRGRPAGLVVVCSDQSARHAVDAARRHAEARFSTVVAALDEGIAVVGADGSLHAVNDAVTRLLQVPGTELARALFTGDGLDPRRDAETAIAFDDWPVQAVLRTAEAVTDEHVWVRRPDGSRAWLRLNVHPLPSPGGIGSAWLPTVVCSFTDVTAQRASSDALAYAASHDTLTALPNRSAMQAELEDALRTTAPGRPVAVLFCDLDRFKDINDSLGHHVGDLVLRQVADRLRGLMRGGDVVGRLGGDEFIVITADVDEGEALAVARRVIGELARPFRVALETTTVSLTVGASVGVALSSAMGASTTTAGDLLQAADVAMYQAKARGRNRVEVFDASLRDLAKHRLETQEDLRNALEAGGLDVHYQPLWTAAPDGSAPKMVGVEALVRWFHPTRGPQSPLEFVMLAEETGLISTLGAYVLERACAQTAAWRADGRDLYVSVNLSARQLSDVDLIPMVERVLATTGLPPDALWLELTESALADETIDAASVLDGLVALGVRISIDDFGTGYSSLGRLRHLPVSALKIDKSFVADLTPDSATDGIGDGGAIVESTIALAHRLGLSVIAEGVETEAQLAGLSALGCDVIQGYLLGRPVAAEALLPIPSGAPAV